jgi:DNA recombination protein RmuC
MMESLVIASLGLLAVVMVLQIILIRRKVGIDLSSIEQSFQSVERAYERTERVVREEIGKNRDEASNAARQSREELGNTLRGVGEATNHQLAVLTQTNDQKLDLMRQTIEQRLQLIQDENGKKLEQVRQDALSSAKTLREEVATTLKGFNEALVASIGAMGRLQKAQLDVFAEWLEKLTTTLDVKLGTMRETIEQRLTLLQEDNGKRLEQMRQTVDEKLQGTLEKRLGESFKQVSERLEAVHKGLGEMQQLATGVGDLKKVLTNVKTRGTWGEVQLGALLEQVLHPEQFEMTVATLDGNERVEYAIKLPGRGEDHDDIVWLPIDAKFPVEDYQRLMDAQEKADVDGVELAARQLEIRVRACAADICEKYISPPKTTDFGILFLPTEGLFAEVVRRKGLTEVIQRECRVVIAGPTTLWSLLNSLQMGFRTLAIQQRSSEVWNLLAAVKTEWGKYGEVLGRVQKKLQEASNTLDQAQTRTRMIGKKLRQVQELPATDAQAMLLLGDEGEDGEEVAAGSEG